MSEPILPLPAADAPRPASDNTGEGAQTALAAMIRKRRMGENHVEDRPALPSPSQLPPT